MATRYGPSGDDYYARPYAHDYNTLHITKVYALPGKSDAKWCSLGVPGSCGPEPQWYRNTIGWLYEARSSEAELHDATYYLWYSNGYEMDEPLTYIQDPLAALVISHSVVCK